MKKAERRKGGKRRKKAEKADLVVQLAFWQKLSQKERQATKIKKYFGSPVNEPQAIAQKSEMT